MCQQEQIWLPNVKCMSYELHLQTPPSDYESQHACQKWRYCGSPKRLSFSLPDLYSTDNSGIEDRNPREHMLFAAIHRQNTTFISIISYAYLHIIISKHLLPWHLLSSLSMYRPRESRTQNVLGNCAIIIDLFFNGYYGRVVSLCLRLKCYSILEQKKWYNGFSRVTRL